MVKNAVQCHFSDGTAGDAQQFTRLHVVRDVVLISLGFLAT